MAKDMPKGDTPVTIKKYANRRLYNTAKSSYVTLEHLAQMVRDGQDFVVYDAKSGDDITRSVLTQIIFEEEAKGATMLPVNFLRQLIRLYGDTLQGVVPSYLEASMDAFARNQETMRSQMRAAMGANPAYANFEALTRHQMEWMEKAMAAFPPFAAIRPPAAKPAEPDAAPTPAPRTATDLDALKDQITQMQARLDALARDKSD